ncbi:hypothetical protein AWZ03_012116 [Drosophila navojoa]|uniref:Uncharacterized protein n=1 Tax=Drosophila navojoa TaxID=7232 RepID=A0A484AXY1_DRONA|nr:uncharacterized protein LOC108657303 [Drosophila navojoa]TDG41459.1 hypothetical protein AWZ03_012116 [Drosophila navojoa]
MLLLISVGLGLTLAFLSFGLLVVLPFLAILMVLLCLGLLLLSRKSVLIFDKYPSKGIFYRLKYQIALLVLRKLRDRIYKRNEEELSSASHLATLDRPQPLTDDPKSYDVVSLMAANAAGEKLMITLERRRRGVLKAALYLWLPSGKLYMLPKLPDMVHFTSDGSEESTEFRGAGFHIYPEQAMTLWRVKYVGQLRSEAEQELVDVQLDMQFVSQTAHFNYNRDLSSSLIADSVAREAWNESFYGMLKSVGHIVEKRTHYEQYGQLKGSIVLGQQQLQLELRSIRDHSFGTERCLSSINRYVYFALLLDDGSSMVVGNLSQPSFFLSSLKVGYVCTPEGVYQAITASNFELYSYGEKGVPPQHQNFIVETAERSYLVQIRVEHSAVRFVGGDWESKVYNQFVACTVNGIGGQGHAEYLYRHKMGRPDAVSAKDPEWYQRIKSFERSLSTLEPVIEEDFIF